MKLKSRYCFNKNYFIISIFIVIFILFICASYYLQNKCIQCSLEKQLYANEISDKLEDLAKSLKNNKNLESYTNLASHDGEPLNNNNNNNKEIVVKIDNSRDESQTIKRSPKEINSLDRVINPLRYPYKSDYFYDQSWYPNLNLPFQVIGGGRRTMPTLGGTEVPIYNPPVPINISNENIAPVYINTRGPLGEPQQVGTIYKIYGDNNEYLPLFGRRRYQNDNIYEYYTAMGYHNVKVPIVVKDKHVELGTNDIVFLKGKPDPYRVTIYESDMPQYIPYL